jgi:hypothetical protein
MSSVGKLNGKGPSKGLRLPHYGWKRWSGPPKGSNRQKPERKLRKGK